MVLALAWYWVGLIALGVIVVALAVFPWSWVRNQGGSGTWWN